MRCPSQVSFKLIIKRFQFAVHRSVIFFADSAHTFQLLFLLELICFIQQQRKCPHIISTDTEFVYLRSSPILVRGFLL